MTWTREGATEVDTGEISGMDGPNPGDEIVGPDFTAYYRNGDLRWSSTYYVVKTTTSNQPDPDEVAWVVEVVEHGWTVDENGENKCDSDEFYEYNSASDLFYYTEQAAMDVAQRCADTDESCTLMWEEDESTHVKVEA